VDSNCIFSLLHIINITSVDSYEEYRGLTDEERKNVKTEDSSHAVVLILNRDEHAAYIIDPHGVCDFEKRFALRYELSDRLRYTIYGTRAYSDQGKNENCLLYAFLRMLYVSFALNEQKKELSYTNLKILTSVPIPCFLTVYFTRCLQIFNGGILQGRHFLEDLTVDVDTYEPRTLSSEARHLQRLVQSAKRQRVLFMTRQSFFWKSKLRNAQEELPRVEALLEKLDRRIHFLTRNETVVVVPEALELTQDDLDFINKK